MQKTFMQKTSDVKREWHLIDAKDKVLGRLASEIAELLIGKQKKDYTPHIDAGDFVVVINAAEIAVTGNKEDDKKYYRHSGFPGGLKVRTLGELRETFPERIIEKAVKNMLPKNKLQSPRMTRMKVFAGAEHPHATHFKK
ncbi:MAG: 50S ribosomal protein L13 [Candidatus Pacebacteria bacterium]|nr:50S ribosomal protein L13 [Candidatus Paceibacterota bacterium]PIR64061.1 MAG: 50S ribosomal protein L13 [Candidatus Pacebacteria bacterium CG10_big_fil_rev_8_21_14_0_10_40_26]PIZ78165.1 MAG: 50S ribosomal protein L13 [Candidatus Pacebacteria bacterium CG_4_10_14_0_2_um_filter_40_20]PJA69137.1 MAG: 50S ribosomal protein L13 [Candidatus Pacebacteria bacterium CG_4_9_14_3_um_filter_40_12]PJC41730.1 MAG: 50S ribosomal protein L13 [Candidatus Pacebacteria bacterium CG_4_9_14_0_2_um_filter_40_15]